MRRAENESEVKNERAGPFLCAAMQLFSAQNTVLLLLHSVRLVSAERHKSAQSACLSRRARCMPGWLISLHKEMRVYIHKLFGSAGALCIQVLERHAKKVHAQRCHPPPSNCKLLFHFCTWSNRAKTVVCIAEQVRASLQWTLLPLFFCSFLVEYKMVYYIYQ